MKYPKYLLKTLSSPFVDTIYLQEETETSIKFVSEELRRVYTLPRNRIEYLTPITETEEVKTVEVKEVDTQNNEIKQLTLI